MKELELLIEEMRESLGKDECWDHVTEHWLDRASELQGLDLSYAISQDKPDKVTTKHKIL